MKAITLYQPWASWICWSWKWIETREHDRFKGLVGQRIAIHAGKRYDPDALDLAYPYLKALGGSELYNAIRRDNWPLPPPSRQRQMRAYPFGCVLCTVVVQEARWLTAADSQRALIDCDPVRGRRYGLMLTDRVVIDPPRPARGAMGVWNWEEG